MPRDSTEAPSFLVVGDYYLGAFGPAILLTLREPDGPQWLHDLFIQLARNGRVIDLASEPMVRLQNIGALQMSLDRRLGPYVALNRLSKEEQPARFAWIASSSGWMLQAALLEPFIAGHSGHQYLTREGADDALIEVSFGESDVHA
jgi:hypothetical protein